MESCGAPRPGAFASSNLLLRGPLVAASRAFGLVQTLDMSAFVLQTLDRSAFFSTDHLSAVATPLRFLTELGWREQVGVFAPPSPFFKNV